MAFHKKIAKISSLLVLHAKKKVTDIAEKKSKKKEEKKRVSFPSASDNKRQVVEVSLVSALQIVAIVFAFLLAEEMIGRLSDILITVFLALFLASAIIPGVNKLEEYKIPRGVGIIILYFAVFGFLGFLMYDLFPVIIEQVQRIWEWLYITLVNIQTGNLDSLPAFLQNYAPQIQNMFAALNEYVESKAPTEEGPQGILDILGENQDRIQELGQEVGVGVTAFILTVVNGAFNLILLLVMTFFMVMDSNKITRFFVQMFSVKYQPYVEKKTEEMHEKISAWIHGQAILFFLVGLITWIGLVIIGVEYAITLAFVAGVCEFIPYIGPIIAFATAAPVAFGQGFEFGVAVVILYILIQALEGNVLVPMVMNKAIGLPPVVTIVVMLIGFEFLGILGVIVSVPIASIAEIFISDYQMSNIASKKGRSKNVTPPQE